MNPKLLWDLLRGTLRGFLSDDCPSVAAGIAYYALFSVFPLALGLIAVLGFVLEPGEVQPRVLGFLVGLFPGSQELVAQNIEGVVAARGAIGLISLAGLLWSATGVMGAMGRALNRAWRVERERSFLRQKLLELTMVAAVGALLLGSIAATAALRLAWGLMPPELRGLQWQPLWGMSVGLAPLLLTLGVFGLLYRHVPNAHVRWRDVWPGALVAGLCFEGGKNLFAWYLAAFADYALVYGSLGAVIAFLTWAYYSSLILLLGAELSAEWSRLRRQV